MKKYTLQWTSVQHRPSCTAQAQWISLWDLTHDLKSRAHEQFRNKGKSETLAKGRPWHINITVIHSSVSNNYCLLINTAIFNSTKTFFHIRILILWASNHHTKGKKPNKSTPNHKKSVTGSAIRLLKIQEGNRISLSEL